eukprot:snap_masked-scaffold_22-processed-gene-5.42-mRNA-1 protein AED:1.00 eAED:1.00 QI:0/-1/0/0/-1/1/1/0/395
MKLAKKITTKHIKTRNKLSKEHKQMRFMLRFFSKSEIAEMLQVVKFKHLYKIFQRFCSKEDFHVTGIFIEKFLIEAGLKAIGVENLFLLMFPSYNICTLVKTIIEKKQKVYLVKLKNEPSLIRITKKENNEVLLNKQNYLIRHFGPWNGKLVHDPVILPLDLERSENIQIDNNKKYEHRVKESTKAFHREVNTFEGDPVYQSLKEKYKLVKIIHMVQFIQVINNILITKPEDIFIRILERDFHGEVNHMIKNIHHNKKIRRICTLIYNSGKKLILKERLMKYPLLIYPIEKLQNTLQQIIGFKGVIKTKSRTTSIAKTISALTNLDLTVNSAIMFSECISCKASNQLEISKYNTIFCVSCQREIYNLLAKKLGYQFSQFLLTQLKYIDISKLGFA